MIWQGIEGGAWLRVAEWLASFVGGAMVTLFLTGVTIKSHLRDILRVQAELLNEVDRLEQRQMIKFRVTEAIAAHLKLDGLVTEAGREMLLIDSQQKRSRRKDDIHV